MPIPAKEVRQTLSLLLQEEHDKLSQTHYKCAPKNGTIPVGGGDWMDSFFKMESVRGCLNALRAGETLSESISQGKTVSEIAIKIWNGRREWQVHRWEKCAHHYLDSLIVRLKRQAKAVKSSKIARKESSVASKR